MLSRLNALDRYPWTGHAGMLGRHLRECHDADLALGYFGENKREAKACYKQFVSAGISCHSQTDLEGGGLIRSLGGWESLSRLRNEHVTSIGDERILGGKQFVEKSLEHDKLAITRRTLLQQQGWTFQLLIQRVCSVCGISEDELGAKARRNNLSLAKSLICYWGKEKLGLTCRAMGTRLGISQQAVSEWVAKGRAHCARGNACLNDLVD